MDARLSLWQLAHIIAGFRRHRRTANLASRGIKRLVSAELGDLCVDRDGLFPDGKTDDDAAESGVKAAAPPPGEEELQKEEDQAVAFWRISSRQSSQLRTCTVSATCNSLDYFVSHVWRPPDGIDPQAVAKYVWEKCQTLRCFGVVAAALGGKVAGSESAPHFIIEGPRQDPQQPAAQPELPDPKDAWRRWRCWVDKACAASPTDGSVPTSLELLTTTKVALRSCRSFLALLTVHYFSRLWCVFEWAAFLTAAAPHYRAVELAIPRHLTEDEGWQRLVDSVVSFSMFHLRTGSESDHPELWRELDGLGFLTTGGLEEFLQATALAALARHALLLCGDWHKTFCWNQGTQNQLTPVVQACASLGFEELAEVIRAAKPQKWWTVANFKAKLITSAPDVESPKAASVENTMDEEDPMEQLKRWCMQCRQKAAVADEPPVLETPFKAAEFAMKGLASHNYRPMVPKHSDGGDSSNGSSAPVEDENAKVFRDNAGDSSLQSVSSPPEDEKAKVMRQAQVVGQAHGLQSTSRAIGRRPFRAHTSAALDSAKEERKMPPPKMRTAKTSQNLEAMSEPVSETDNGLLCFWRGLRGEELEAEDHHEACTFHSAWALYLERVNLWFDKRVCPALERFRAKGLRSRGPLEDALSGIVHRLSVSLSDALCEYVAPGAREAALAREPPPRGRPSRPGGVPWANPTLDRLLVVSEERALIADSPRGDGKALSARLSALRKPAPSPAAESIDGLLATGAMQRQPPAILASALPLRLRRCPEKTLLCTRFGDDTTWTTLWVPKALGTQALVDASKQLVSKGSISGRELMVICPRLALDIEGMEHAQVTLGMCASGMLRPMRPEPRWSRETLVRTLSPTLPPAISIACREPGEGTQAEVAADTMTTPRQASKPQACASTPRSVAGEGEAATPSAVDVTMSLPEGADGLKPEETPSDDIDWEMWKIVEPSRVTGQAPEAPDGNFDNYYNVADDVLYHGASSGTYNSFGCDDIRGAFVDDMGNPLPGPLPPEKLWEAKLACTVVLPKKRHSVTVMTPPHPEGVPPSVTFRPPRHSNVSDLREFGQKRAERVLHKLNAAPPVLMLSGTAASKDMVAEVVAQARVPPLKLEPLTPAPESPFPTTPVPSPTPSRQPQRLSHLPPASVLSLDCLAWRVRLDGGADETRLATADSGFRAGPPDDDTISVSAPSHTRPRFGRRGAVAHVGCTLDGQTTWTGTYAELFLQLDDWFRRSHVPHWVPIDAITRAHGQTMVSNQRHRGLHPMVARRTKAIAGMCTAAGADGGHDASPRLALQDSSRRNGDGGQKEVPLSGIARSPLCEGCGETDVATVPLAGSMLRRIWNAASCTVCLTCGLTRPLPGEERIGRRERATASDGCAVLEVCTALYVDQGPESNFQQLIAGVLRVHASQVAVAGPHNSSPCKTKAQSHLAEIGFTSTNAGIAAAVSASRRCRSGKGVKGALPNAFTDRQRGLGLFRLDCAWLYNHLSSTGLDIVYTKPRTIEIEDAIAELDDARMMPQREDVSPLVLWAELGYVLSQSFDLRAWLAATAEVLELKQLSLPAAIRMRSMIRTLQRAVGVPTEQMQTTPKCVSMSNAESRPPLVGRSCSWLQAKNALRVPRRLSVPLAYVPPSSAQAVQPTLGLHRVLLARTGDVELVIKTGLAGAGVKAGNFAALLEEGVVALQQAHEEMTKSLGRDGMTNDVGMVMRDLAFRRLSNGPAEQGKLFRATLRARRLLHQMKVTEYLTDLEAIMIPGKLDWLSWRRASTISQDHGGESGQEAGVARLVDTADEDSDEFEEADDAPPATKADEVTVQRVLGHAHEFVHYAKIVVKALAIARMLLRAIATVARVATAAKHLQGGSAEKPVSGDSAQFVENKVLASIQMVRQAFLQCGFVYTALRAIYRHPHREDICTHAAKCLEMLCTQEEPSFVKRIQQEFLVPPQRFMTLLQGATRFSERGYTEALRCCFRVLELLCPEGSSTDVGVAAKVPEGRELEVATSAVSMLERHEGQGAGFANVLRLFLGLVQDPALAWAFYQVGTSAKVRQWLKASAVQEPQRKWILTLDSQLGPCKKLKQCMMAVADVARLVKTCEAFAWRLVTLLILSDCEKEGVVGEAAQEDADAQAEMAARKQRFETEVDTLVEQVITEMERAPRGTQWTPAITCLTQLLLHSNGKFASRVLAADGLALAMNEFPSGDVATMLQFVRALVGASSAKPKQMPKGEFEEDPSARSGESTPRSPKTPRQGQADVLRGQPRSRPGISRGRTGVDGTEGKGGRLTLESGRLTPADAVAKPGTPTQSLSEEYGEGIMSARTQLGSSKDYVGRLIASIRPNMEDQSYVAGVLRVLGELMIDKAFGAPLVAAEMRTWGEHYGGGLLELVACLKAHPEDTSVVCSAIHLLVGTMKYDMVKGQTVKLLNDIEGGLQALVAACWDYIDDRDVYIAALDALMQIHEEDASARENLCTWWTERRGLYIEREVEKLKSLPVQKRRIAKRSSSDIRVSLTEDENGGVADRERLVARAQKRVPYAAKRFGAWLRVNAFSRNPEKVTLFDILEPFAEHSRDETIVRIAIRALVTNASESSSEWYRTIHQTVPDFSDLLRECLMLPGKPDAIFYCDVLQLLIGLTGCGPQDMDDYIDATAMASSMVMDAVQENVVDCWEHVLNAILVIAPVTSGKRILKQYGVRLRMEKLWQKMMESDDHEVKLCVRNMKKETLKAMRVVAHEF